MEFNEYLIKRDIDEFIFETDSSEVDEFEFEESRSRLNFLRLEKWFVMGVVLTTRITQK